MDGQQLQRRHGAIENLQSNQGRLDADGVIVSVSRQALDETLAIIEDLIVAAERVVLATDAMAPLDRADDEAFISEAKFRSLLTFGDIKGLRAALLKARGEGK